MAADWLRRWSGAPGPLPEWLDVEQALIVHGNVANRFRNERQFDMALQLQRQGIELSRTQTADSATRQRAALLLGQTWVLRDRGDLEEALRTVREAQAALQSVGAEPLKFVGPRSSFAQMLNTEGELLGQVDGPSLGRPAEALAALTRAFTIADELAHADPVNAVIRGTLATNARLLGDCLGGVDDVRALETFDHALTHLAEVKNNPRHRREEASLLAHSTRPLRHLRRFGEAHRRLDVAMDRLAVTHQYPADEVEADSEVDQVLSARAETFAAEGRVDAAIESYQRLLQLVLAANPEPNDDIRDAAAMSRLFRALARLSADAGRGDGAAEYLTRARTLWQRWEERLPHNPYVRRQLEATEGWIVAPAR
jgi:tetratricopeptide (TPR) repeat protein